MSSWFTGFGPQPGNGPYTPWQKMVSMAVFGVVYGGVAWYAAAERNWSAFSWVTALALLAFGSSIGGMRIWRRQQARKAADALGLKGSKSHLAHTPPHRQHPHSGGKRRH